MFLTRLTIHPDRRDFLWGGNCALVSGQVSWGRAGWPGQNFFRYFALVSGSRAESGRRKLPGGRQLPSRWSDRAGPATKPLSVGFQCLSDAVQRIVGRIELGWSAQGRRNARLQGACPIIAKLATLCALVIVGAGWALDQGRSRPTGRPPRTPPRSSYQSSQRRQQGLPRIFEGTQSGPIREIKIGIIGSGVRGSNAREKLAENRQYLALFEVIHAVVMGQGGQTFLDRVSGFSWLKRTRRDVN